MWLERLHQLQIIDATATAMGQYIQQYSGNESELASVLCALSTQAIKNGHTCLDCNNIILQFPALSQYPEFLETLNLDSVLTHPLIGFNNLQKNTLFTFTSPYLFTNKLFALESKLIKQIAWRLNSIQINTISSNALRLSELCFNKPLTILSGGPGTGKTTVFAQAIPHWIERFQLEHHKIPRIILCAPTGKAAARMSESWIFQKHKFVDTHSPIYASLPEQALTIHRLLGIHPINRHARFNENNLLSVDLLIIDESSMLDLPILVKLLEACPISAHILLIGDQQQLPAIEAGYILGSLFNTESTHWFFKKLLSAHLHLSHNFRQQDKPGLTSLANDCLNQEVDIVINKLDNNQYPDVTFCMNTDVHHKNLISRAVTLYKEITNCTNVEQALLNLHSFIILTAVRNGPSGCIAINNEIIRQLNPTSQTFFHGQILLITENASHLNLTNGDIVIIWLTLHGLRAYFNFNGTTHNITIDNLPQHEAAYAITIHKAQGSEYDNVVMILPMYDSTVLNNSLIYTGITRAKNSLEILATHEILASSLNNDSKRVNGLLLLAENLVENEI